MKILRLVLIVVVILAGAGITIKIISSFEKEYKPEATTESSRLVDVRSVSPKTNFAKIELLGKLIAKDKIELFAEVTGVLVNDNFEEGNSFTQGATLVNINSDEFAQNLKSQKGKFITEVAQVLADIKIDFPGEYSTWESFLNEIDVNQSLPDLPSLENQKLKRFIAGKGLLTSYYNVQSSEERLSKYLITAPFSGSLVSANVKKGALVRVGQKVGEFISTASFDFETEVSLSDLNYLKKGTKVKLTSETGSGNWLGTVQRINQQVDPGTQRVKVYVVVSGEGLKDGMFLQGTTNGIQLQNSVAVERQQIRNSSVFVVNEGVIQEREVEVLFEDDQFAYVRGLKNNDLLLVSNLKGLYGGLKVKTKK